MKLRRHRAKLPSIAVLCIASYIFWSHFKQPNRFNVVDRIVLQITAPILSIGKTTKNWANSTLYGFKAARDKDKELTLLRSEVQSLKNQIVQVSQLDKKLKEYQALLALKESSPLQSVAATVIGYNTHTQYPSLTIEFSRSVDVRSGYAVFGTQGIIGRISKIAGKYAIVSIIGNPKLAIDVETKEAHVHGILKASGSSRYLFKLRFVPQHEEIHVGDKLVSTGAAGIYPSGMPVGEVIRVHQDSSKLYKDIDVSVSANSFRGDEVLISLSNKETEPIVEHTLKAHSLNP